MLIKTGARQRWLLPSAVLLGFLLPALPGGARPEANADLQPEIFNLLPPPAAPPETIRVVTFNIHYGRDLKRLEESLRTQPALRAADVILLQEIESYPSEGSSRARQLAEALQLNYVYAPARRTPTGGTHGLAILSRFPLSAVEVLPLPQFDLGYNTRRRIALAATLEVAGQPLRVFNLHLDTRLNSADRLAQLRPVLEAARAQPAAAVVIAGDFNTNSFRWLRHVVPVFLSDQAAAVDAGMKENGFDTPSAQSGSTSRRRLLKFRLDSLYTRGLSVRAAGVERSVDASDHLPVWIDILWPPAPPLAGTAAPR